MRRLNNTPHRPLINRVQYVLPHNLNHDSKLARLWEDPHQTTFKCLSKVFCRTWRACECSQNPILASCLFWTLCAPQLMRVGRSNPASHMRIFKSSQARQSDSVCLLGDSKHTGAAVVGCRQVAMSLLAQATRLGLRRLVSSMHL